MTNKLDASYVNELVAQGLIQSFTENGDGEVGAGDVLACKSGSGTNNYKALDSDDVESVVASLNQAAGKTVAATVAVGDDVYVGFAKLEAKDHESTQDSSTTSFALVKVQSDTDQAVVQSGSFKTLDSSYGFYTSGFKPVPNRAVKNCAGDAACLAELVNNHQSSPNEARRNLADYKRQVAESVADGVLTAAQVAELQRLIQIEAQVSASASNN